MEDDEPEAWPTSDWGQGPKVRQINAPNCYECIELDRGCPTSGQFPRHLETREV